MDAWEFKQYQDYRERERFPIEDIPFIPVKEGWLIKPIFPFAGAVARFLVSDKS